MEAVEIEAVLRLLELGVVGIGLVLFLTGRIHSKSAFERESQRADRLEQENREIRDRVEKDVIPLLIRAADALTRSARREG